MSVSRQSSRPLKITVVAADDLPKHGIFRNPDPFAVVTVDAEQTCTTGVIWKSLNPHWSDSFMINVARSSIITIRVFDQRMYKKNDQGFLGAANIRVADIIHELEAAGNGRTLLLNLSSENALIARGRLTIVLSTDLQQPIVSSGPPQASGVQAAFPSVGHNGSTVPVNNFGGGNPYVIPRFTVNTPMASIDQQLLPSTPRATASTIQKPLPGVPNAMNPDPRALQSQPQLQPQPQPQLQSQPTLQPQSQPQVRQYDPQPGISNPNPGRATNLAHQNHGPPDPLPSAEPQQQFSPHEDQFGFLPHGWERRADGLGRTFYINHTTKSTTWERPTANQPTNSSPAVETGPLPDGWEERYNPNGRVYYLDHKNMATSWVDPRCKTAVRVRGPGGEVTTQLRQVGQLGPLPLGWEMRLAPNGRVYFLNTPTRTTTWNDPRSPLPFEANVIGDNATN